MKVILYNVGRNLNRAFRTCFSFGIDEMILINSNDRTIEFELKGNLYQAKNNVKITRLTEIPKLNNIVALENYYSESIYNINILEYEYILIGGESTGLPKNVNVKKKATIPTINNFCLTVEASLAIALSEFNRRNHERTI